MCVNHIIHFFSWGGGDKNTERVNLWKNVFGHYFSVQLHV